MQREDLVTTIEIRDRSGRVVDSKEVVRYAGLLNRAREEGLTTSSGSSPTRGSGAMPPTTTCKEAFGTGSLQAVTKEQASSLIDKLLGGAGAGKSA